MGSKTQHKHAEYVISLDRARPPFGIEPIFDLDLTGLRQRRTCPV